MPSCVYVYILYDVYTKAARKKPKRQREAIRTRRVAGPVVGGARRTPGRDPRQREATGSRVMVLYLRIEKAMHAKAKRNLCIYVLYSIKQKGVKSEREASYNTSLGMSASQRGTVALTTLRRDARALLPLSLLSLSVTIVTIHSLSLVDYPSSRIIVCSQISFFARVYFAPIGRNSGANFSIQCAKSRNNTIRQCVGGCSASIRTRSPRVCPSCQPIGMENR